MAKNATKTKPKKRSAKKKKAAPLPPQKTDHKRAELRAITKDLPPATVEEMEAMAEAGKPKKVAGPFAMYPHHRNLWRAAAKERSRYTLNAVALYPEIPGLVATDGRVLATLPLQKVDPKTGDLGEWGSNFHAPGGDPILLPLKLFKEIPSRLEHDQGHIELTIISLPTEMGLKRFAIVDHCPYGNRYRYHLDIEGQYPEYTSVLKSADDYEPKRGVEINLDVNYLVNLAKAIGSKQATLKVFDTKVMEASLMMPGVDYDGPSAARGTGIIMPITMPEPSK